GVEGAGTEAREWAQSPDHDRIAADRDWLVEPNHHLITCHDADFPALLADVPGAPAALFIVGDPAKLWMPQIAIVGSRNASQGGIATAKAFARAFATAGFTVTSGMAQGIDGAAHAAAMDAGGATIAVLGTGPDQVYPRSQRELAQRIATDHVLVSEYPPGTTARPGLFPRRNRIIAGLSLGTLVVEAGVQSGSLITARLAAEQGREVFAIPGSIHNPMARGCHRLIRDGAKLIETADEVIVELRSLAGELGERLRERLGVDNTTNATMPDVAVTRPALTQPDRRSRDRQRDPDYGALLQALGHDSVAIDVLAERTGLAVDALSSMLFLLELEGDVVTAPGGHYARRVP
ncbi:MAG: DNA-processing protein DprA, partial [Dokdonella sp.]